MASILLGTGAAEGIPCVFCTCPTCQRARREGGREVRTRSSLLLDDTTVIDLGQDALWQLFSVGRDLSRLRHILLTHFHDDHFGISTMICRMCAVPTPTDPVTVWLSAAAAEQMRAMWARYRPQDAPAGECDYFARYELAVMEPFVTRRVGARRVTPLLTDHPGYGIGERGFNYLIETPGAGTFLYAVDTGWYPEETWRFLTGRRVDGIVMECTYGDQALPRRPRQHLDLTAVEEMLHRLEETKTIDRHTPVILSHISHLHTASFARTEELLGRIPYTVRLGYDGMELPF